VYNALKFAEELVVDWLVKYKFRNWVITETRKIPVTDEMRKERANEIAMKLTDRTKWRSHGRSIRIGDLEEKVGLKIVRIDDDAKLSDTVYRIQTVCRLLFGSTNTYKIFATEREKVFKTATPIGVAPKIPIQAAAEVVEFETKCPQCGKVHKLYAKFVDNPKIDEDFQKKGDIAYPKDNKLRCDCGFEIDLSGIRNEIEVRVGRKLVL